LVPCSQSCWPALYFPAALVAGHGLFVLVSLLFVLLATIAAS
jgi:hypothetical protein